MKSPPWLLGVQERQGPEWEGRQGGGLCAGPGETGAREGAVDEDRGGGRWVVSALPVWYPRCTGAPPCRWAPRQP